MCVAQFSLVSDKSEYKQSSERGEGGDMRQRATVMSGLTLRQVVYGFGCIPLCIIGLLGNIFSLLVLYPSKYNQTKVRIADGDSGFTFTLSQGLFYGYLGVLSVTDIIWLLINLTFRFILQNILSQT